jgi:hypothetical protein
MAQLPQRQALPTGNLRGGAMSPGQVVLLLCLSVVALLFLLGGRNDDR